MRLLLPVQVSEGTLTQLSQHGAKADELMDIAKRIRNEILSTYRRAPSSLGGACASPLPQRHMYPKARMKA